MPHAFVTGATGFLGRHLVEALVRENWTVCALHRPTSDIRHLEHPAIRPVPGDVLDPDSMASALKQKTDAVFHVAASTNQWRLNNHYQEQVNVTGTRNVVRAALRHGHGRFVHTSSIAVYGIHHGIITEETPSNALTYGSNYMRTKYLAEKEVEAGIREGLDAVFINPPHIMGRYDRHNWVRLFQLVATDRLPGIPPGRGTFVHAPEVARTHIRAVSRGRTGERYLLGGADASFLEIVQGIGTLLGKQVGDRTMPAWILRMVGWISEWGSRFTRREPDLTPEKVQLVTEELMCGGEKAAQELGHRVIPLGIMLKDTCEWLRENGLLEAAENPD